VDVMVVMACWEYIFESWTLDVIAVMVRWI